MSSHLAHIPSVQGAVACTPYDYPLRSYPQTTIIELCPVFRQPSIVYQTKTE